MIAKIIQPRPRPGRGEDGATITGGGGLIGGGGGGGGAYAGGGGGVGGAWSSINSNQTNSMQLNRQGVWNCQRAKRLQPSLTRNSE
jgi:hypothetical protein